MFPFLILHNYNWTWFHRLKRDFPSFFIMGSAAVRMRSGAECCPAWSFKASGLVQYVRKHLKRWDFLSFFKIGSAAARKRKSQFNYKTLSFEIYDKKFFFRIHQTKHFSKKIFQNYYLFDLPYKKWSNICDNYFKNVSNMNIWNFTFFLLHTHL